jgi:hypothetical protein
MRLSLKTWRTLFVQEPLSGIRYNDRAFAKAGQRSGTWIIAVTVVIERLFFCRERMMRRDPGVEETETVEKVTMRARPNGEASNDFAARTLTLLWRTGTNRFLDQCLPRRTGTSCITAGFHFDTVTAEAASVC